MSVALAFLSGIALVWSLVVLHERRYGFLGQRPEDYATGAVFDLRRHLDGPMTCDGAIFGPTGRVVSRFTARFDVVWSGDKARMQEHFRYDSGSEQHRAWQLTLGEGGAIRAEAADVVGTGHGRQHGSAVQLKYRLRLEEDAGGHVLNVTDWMYLGPDGTIVNRSQFRKFGVKVAELVATLRPLEAP